MTTLHRFNHLGCLTIAGNNACDFLQGQLTCDVKALTHGQSCLGGYCNHQGRLLATFHLLQWNNDYIMLLAQDLLNAIQTTLRKYAAFSKVSVNIADDRVIYAVIHNKALPSNYQHMPHINVSKTRSYLIDHTSSITAPTSDAFTLAWQQQDIEEGLAHVIAATQALWIPQMINLEKHQGVSFTKGCYVGQEVIARIQHLGKLKRHLFSATTHQALNPGDVILNQKEQPKGHVVSSTHFTDNNQLLCVLQQSAIKEPLFCQQQPLEAISAR